jgi:hypothetical protein
MLTISQIGKDKPKVNLRCDVCEKVYGIKLITLKLRQIKNKENSQFAQGFVFFFMLVSNKVQRLLRNIKGEFLRLIIQ